MQKSSGGLGRQAQDGRSQVDFVRVLPYGRFLTLSGSGTLFLLFDTLVTKGLLTVD